MGRAALGKGLEAIFRDKGHEVVDKDTGSQVHELRVEAIQPNPFQPRTHFEQSEIEDLAQSIKEKGILQPILVRRHEGGYQIVAGERRFRAVSHLKLPTIPALVRDRLSDRDMMEMALIENLQRVQLNPIEEAHGIEKLITNCGLTHEQVAERMGKSRSSITNTLRLLRLSPEVQSFVQSGRLSSGHARAILQESPERQKVLALRIMDQDINVREAEKLGSANKPRKPLLKDPNLEAFLLKIQESLGTKVSLRGSIRRGSLEIHFSSQEELEALAERLKSSATD